MVTKEYRGFFYYFDNFYMNWQATDGKVTLKSGSQEAIREKINKFISKKEKRENENSIKR